MPNSGSTTSLRETSRSTITSWTRPCSWAPSPSATRACGPVDPLDRYFAMARGGILGGKSVTALEMTKWFDTNYHYLVPELTSGQRFSLSSAKPLDELRQAAAMGVTTRPVILGPVSFLLLSKHVGNGTNLDLLPALCEVYAELLGAIAAAGASWVQIDEPVLALDLDPEQRRRLHPRLRSAPGSITPASAAGRHLLRRSGRQPSRRRCTSRLMLCTSMTSPIPTRWTRP